MGKGRPERKKRNGDLPKPLATASIQENTAAVKPEDFAQLFRPLDRDPPEIDLQRPDSTTQTPASSDYHDARSAKDDVSDGPSSTIEWDSVTDRSTSPFEIVYDEATRDLVRTPSPDEYYPRSENPINANTGVGSQSPIGPKTAVLSTKKGKQKPDSKGHRTSIACVHIDDLKGEPGPATLETAQHLEAPKTRRECRRK